jgi:hypothetical protein
VLGSHQTSVRSLRLCSCLWPFFFLLLDLPSEPFYSYVSCLSLLFHLGPVQVQLLEKPSEYRLTHHLFHWEHEPQANVELLELLVSIPPC